MTAEEALAALDRGEAIHVQGEEMRRFIVAIDGASARADTPKPAGE